MPTCPKSSSRWESVRKAYLPTPSIRSTWLFGPHVHTASLTTTVASCGREGRGRAHARGAAAVCGKGDEERETAGGGRRSSASSRAVVRRLDTSTYMCEPRCTPRHTQTTGLKLTAMVHDLPGETRPFIGESVTAEATSGTCGRAHAKTASTCRATWSGIEGHVMERCEFVITRALPTPLSVHRTQNTALLRMSGFQMGVSCIRSSNHSP